MAKTAPIKSVYKIYDLQSAHVDIEKLQSLVAESLKSKVSVFWIKK